MKSILYVGATLMIGASIYGFVDYKKTSRNNEFKKMYQAKELTDQPQPVNGNQKTVTDIQTVNKELPAKIIAEKHVAVTEKPKAVKRKKQLSYKLFSRAPLEEKYIDKELKLDPLKIEPKKTENKEQ